MLFPANLLVFQLILLAHISTSSAQNAEQVQLQEATSTCARFNSYTALGDSYAAGYGSIQTLRTCHPNENPVHDFCTKADCGRDIGAYSYRFAKRHNVSDFQYLACNGNDSLSVLHSQVQTPEFGTPDLITINVGGDDDSLFSHIVKDCVAFRGRNEDEKCQTAIRNANFTIDKLNNGRFAELFNGIKKAIQRRNVKVVVMSYASFWGHVHELPGGSCKEGKSYLNRPSLAERTQMNVLASLLNNALKLRAEEAGFSFVDVDKAFEGHRFCDDQKEYWFQEFMKSFKIQSLFHPTMEGQDAYLKALERELGC